MGAIYGIGSLRAGVPGPRLGRRPTPGAGRGDPGAGRLYRRPATVPHTLASATAAATATTLSTAAGAWLP